MGLFLLWGFHGWLDTILSLVCCVVRLSCILVCFPVINVGCDLLACRLLLRLVICLTVILFLSYVGYKVWFA